MPMQEKVQKVFARCLGPTSVAHNIQAMSKQENGWYIIYYRAICKLNHASQTPCNLFPRQFV